MAAARPSTAPRRLLVPGPIQPNDADQGPGRVAPLRNQQLAPIASWERRRHQIALIDIAFATGTLLGSAGVEFAPIDVEQLGNRETAGVEAAVEAGRN